MIFHRVLFERTIDNKKRETLEAPVFFSDINLDQIIDAITAGKEEYNLKPFYYTSLNDIDAINYRHEVMRDLENKILVEHIKSFAQKMRTMRKHLVQADELHYKYQKKRWFMDAAEIYCDAVNGLVLDLTHVDLKSRGLLAFHEYMTNYANSSRFLSLLTETKTLKAELSTIKYCLLIKGSRVKVCKFNSEMDYSYDVEKTFDKFKQGAVKDYRVDFSTLPNMNHVEAGLWDLVARLYPYVFSNLDYYCAKNGNYLNETTAPFDREIQVYVAYLEHIARFNQVGLKFCYPQISDNSKEVRGLYSVFHGAQERTR